jgi:DNA-binding CsgD family transcriptional regulator
MTRIRSNAVQQFEGAKPLLMEASDRFEADEVAPSRADVAALICPDWRVASLVMDARSGQVTYANTPCLQMLAERSSVQIVSGRIAFLADRLTEKFYAMLDRVVASGLESAAMIERERVGDAFMSIMIRNTQGFLRDVLNRSLGNRDAQFVVVELASSHDQSDWPAMRAFVQAFALTPFEGDVADLVLRGLTLPEIGALKNRQVSDIRQVLKSLLAKTRCKHQAELVRLMMTLCPPTRRA